MNKLIPRIIFYLLVVSVAFAGGLLYYKNTASIGDAATVATDQVTQPNPSGNAPAAASCIITIDGSRYDVQPLRSTHPGGDIFQCGTDMSTVFHGQHGDNLGMIRKYLIK